jgi:hypothetical protein
MQAAMLSLEFLRLRRVGEREAHAIGEDGEPGLRFAHVPYRINVRAGPEWAALQQQIVGDRLAVHAAEDIPGERPGLYVGVLAAQPTGSVQRMGVYAALADRSF